MMTKKICVLFFLMLAGCSSISYTKTEDIEEGSKIFIMPPHDVTQGGKPHPVGVGSGEQLMRSIERELGKSSSYTVLEKQNSSKSDFVAEFTKEDAISAAKDSGARYCLVLRLGEFRNAAPMTFRTDFVTLQDGYLVDTESKKAVWYLNHPFMLEKANIGDHYELIDAIAKKVALSIAN